MNRDDQLCEPLCKISLIAVEASGKSHTTTVLLPFLFQLLSPIGIQKLLAPISFNNIS